MMKTAESSQLQDHGCNLHPDRHMQVSIVGVVGAGCGGLPECLAVKNIGSAGSLIGCGALEGVVDCGRLIVDKLRAC